MSVMLRGSLGSYGAMLAAITSGQHNLGGYGASMWVRRPLGDGGGGVSRGYRAT